MAGETKVTTDLEEIQRFAEACEAVPATVRDTMEGDEPGVLTLDFVGYGAGEESLEHIGWDAWYEKFDAARLALLYQERKADGEPSTFFKLVDRDQVDDDAAAGQADDGSDRGGVSDDEAAAAMAMSLPEPGQTKATTVLEEIQRFAEGCEAVPATVRDTMEGDEPGVLTLDFVGYGAGEESLEHIGWDAWRCSTRSARPMASPPPSSGWSIARGSTRTSSTPAPRRSRGAAAGESASRSVVPTPVRAAPYVPRCLRRPRPTPRRPAPDRASPRRNPVRPGPPPTWRRSSGSRKDVRRCRRRCVTRWRVMSRGC
jgi:hypothetical protein